MNNNKHKFLQGFTLIELLVVIAIIGITLAVAIPSFQAMIASNRLTTTTNNLVSALQLAKSEAIKSNRLVIVSTGTSSNWASGWFIFADKSQNNTQATDGTEPTIGSFEALNTGFTIKPAGVATNYSGNSMVIYRPDGRINADVIFYFCSPVNTADFRKLVIQSTGRVKVQRPTVAGVSYATACS